MIIEVECNAIVTELKKVKDLIETRNTMALLTNALLEAKNGHLTLKATDLELSLITALPVDVIEEGSLAIDANTLLNTIENLKNGASSDSIVIRLESDQNCWAKLSHKRFKCRIPGVHPGDYPEIEVEKDIQFVEMPAAEFLELIRKTKFAMAKNDARPLLTGSFLRMENEGQSLTIVATDGHRLSKMTTPKEFKFEPGTLPSQLEEGVIIPAKGIRLIERHVVVKKGTDEQEPYIFSFGFTDSHMIVKYGMTTYVMRLIEGSFPSFEQLMPSPSQEPIIIDKMKFSFAFNSVKVFANETTNRIGCTFKKNTLLVFASDAETGEGANSFEIDYDGPEIVLGYNYKYMRNVLDVLDSDTFRMYVGDELLPTVIKEAHSDDGSYVVMPMRV